MKLAKSGRRRGMVLFAVLIVVAILLLVGYQYLNVMQAELGANVASNKVAQARRMADSGLHYASFILAYPSQAGLTDDANSLVVSPILAYDNPGVFHQRPVADSEGVVKGYFSLISRRASDDPMVNTQGFRFGVEDESSKINLNALLRLDPTGESIKNALSNLPNMSPDMANSLLNWIRPPNEQDSSGDAMYYSALGYSPKYGPFETFEELVLVRGFSPRMVLGNDRNRNGQLEPEEDDLGGVLDHGFSEYFTIYSRELNVDSQGLPRMFINDKTDPTMVYQQLRATVGDGVANFIMAARVNGIIKAGQRVQTSGQNVENREGGPEFKGNEVNSDQLQDLQSLWDLVDARVVKTETEGGNQKTVIYTSPIKRSDRATLGQVMSILLDKFTTTASLELPPRVNINTAPADVIRILPRMTEADAQKILENRPNAGSDPSLSSVYSTIAWLVTLTDFNPTTMQQLEPYITARSQVYRVQSVGYDENNGPAVRIEAVIDTNYGRPRILYWRDISELGKGFSFSMP